MRRMAGGNFIFIFFLIIMVVNSIQSGRFASPRDWLINTLMLLPAIVIAITFHEFMHAFSAWKLGDQTPKAQGRITLNPLAHIDPVGIIILIFVGFGWGKPVQVNPLAFKKNLRLSNLIVDLAGVATNFVIAFICVPLVFFVQNPTLSTIITYIVYINIVLMLFNLLPIPPLDGFGVLTEIFALRRFSWYRPLYNNGMIILLVFIFIPRMFGYDLLSMFLVPGITNIVGFIYGFWAPILL